MDGVCREPPTPVKEVPRLRDARVPSSDHSSRFADRLGSEGVRRREVGRGPRPRFTPRSGLLVISRRAGLLRRRHAVVDVPTGDLLSEHLDVQSVRTLRGSLSQYATGTSASVYARRESTVSARADANA